MKKCPSIPLFTLLDRGVYFMYVTGTIIHAMLNKRKIFTPDFFSGHYYYWWPFVIIPEAFCDIDLGVLTRDPVRAFHV